MLTNFQIINLAKKMNVPLVGVYFKSELKNMTLKPNKSYIINLDDEFDEDGQRNEGTHYTCFQYNKYSGGDKVIYFDSYGVCPPQEVLNFCKVKEIPYNTKDIQSLMNEACGWYCLAFLHFINAFEKRTNDLYEDCEWFTSLFYDLNVEKDYKFNEWILKMFFKSPNDKSAHTVANVGFTFVADGIANVDTITK
jgi:hypothetical protein